MVTRKELELEIVRCAEREPGRIGLQGGMYSNGRGDFCLVGQACYNLNPNVAAYNMLAALYSLEALRTERGAHEAARQIGRIYPLNDSGMPWGKVVVEAGLVPGEAPAEPVVAEAVEVA